MNTNIHVHGVTKIEAEPAHELSSGTWSRTFTVYDRNGRTVELVLYGDDPLSLRIDS